MPRGVVMAVLLSLQTALALDTASVEAKLDAKVFQIVKIKSEIEKQFKLHKALGLNASNWKASVRVRMCDRAF